MMLLTFFCVSNISPRADNEPDNYGVYIHLYLVQRQSNTELNLQLRMPPSYPGARWISTAQEYNFRKEGLACDLS